MNVLEKDWDLAIQHGIYHQGNDREEFVTLNRIDLAAYVNDIRSDERSACINAITKVRSSGDGDCNC